MRAIGGGMILKVNEIWSEMVFCYQNSSDLLWEEIEKNFWNSRLKAENLTLKDAGVPKVPTGQEIVCHFSQGHAMVTNILDFIHIHPN